ncbi:hypothetical protein C2G38_2046112 [Gigaspora rosea]|uniref:Galactose oxidase n=1 Tax=Gigaspora rosea TaxID=44941 RepID=A0A397UAL6_9GLOM|nr:hypothetical protein C2G38_2046112 [Gigaspora rosea]
MEKTDLNNLSLDGNTVIDSSKWIQVTKNKNTSLAHWPFLGGISNEKLFFATSASYGTSAGVYIDIFDTMSNQWKTNFSFTGKPSQSFEDFKPWITDGSTGKAYSLQYIPGIVEIFDTVNYAWTNSSVIPQTYPTFYSLSLSSLYGPPQNTTGQVPSLRSDYTAVLTSDGRIIIYGGTSNKLPATPSIVVLNASNYVWSTPLEINAVGPLTEHTSIMVNNYMIAAFGKNVTERNSLLQNNKNIYKLDISDPLTYKWSVLSIYNDTTTKSILPPSATPDSTFSSLSNYSSSNNDGLFLGIGVAAAVKSKPKYIATAGSNAIG